jgi:hypothetical protein
MAKDKFKAKKKPEPPPPDMEEEASDEDGNWPDLPTLQDVIDAIKEWDDEKEK